MFDASPTPEDTTTPPQDVFEHYLRADRDENRSLRFSLLLAVLVHIGLLALTLPAASDPVLPTAEDKVIYRLSSPPRFEHKPPPPPEVPRPERPVKVPMPDDTPHDEEPLLRDEPIPEFVLPADDTSFVVVPEAPPPVAPPEPIVVGMGIERPERVVYVDPVYPPVALKVRREGLVILDAIIDTNGSVRAVKVLKSAPMGLTDAALDAVKQWRYQPSTVDGKPVEVRMTVTVIFNLV